MKNGLKSLSFLFILFGLTMGLFGCSKSPTYDMDSIGSRNQFESIMNRYHKKQPFLFGGFMMADELKSEATTDSNDTATDYSRTNTQVVGVDEADSVKTDGKYIYSISQRRVLITQAYPMSEAGYERELTFDDDFNANSLYVDDEYLIVIGEFYEQISTENEKDKYELIYYRESNIRVYLFDKTNLDEVKHTMEFDGYTVTTRKVDNQLLLVTNKWIRQYDQKIEDDVVLPSYSINENETTLEYSDIHYKDGTNPNSLVTVYKVNVDNPEGELEHFTYLGQSDQIYVSPENIYVAQTLYNTHRILFNQSNQEEEDKTYVTKLSYANGLEVKGKVYVNGTIRNQFSMDEYEGNFRITTTRGNRWDGTSTNNLYIYDEELNEIGSVEGLAKGESIQSTRFMGDRIYMVTFRQIDPFFVIDASDATNPQVLGELKIPGFSTYLHPYDENHVIGFGFEADNGGRRTGFKMALYNVTDPSNPIEQFKETILYKEDGYNHSEITYNHKSLLFSKEKNIIAFPFTQNEYQTITETKDGKQVTYSTSVFTQSYKVYGLDLENGFTERASITHFEEGKTEDYRYLNEISRGLYINDYLYTVSESSIFTHDLNDFKLVKKIALPVDEEQPYHHYYRWQFID